MEAQGERMYSSYSFTTSALNGGEWSASRPCGALPPRKGPRVPTGQEAGWVPEPVWTQRLEESLSSAKDRTVTVRHSLIKRQHDAVTLSLKTEASSCCMTKSRCDSMTQLHVYRGQARVLWRYLVALLQHAVLYCARLPLCPAAFVDEAPVALSPLWVLSSIYFLQ
jgi:hypothetical protein